MKVTAMCMYIYIYIHLCLTKKSSFRIDFTVSLFGASGRGCLMIIFRMYITCHGRTWGNWRSTGRFGRFTMKSMEKVEKSGWKKIWCLSPRQGILFRANPSKQLYTSASSLIPPKWVPSNDPFFNKLNRRVIPLKRNIPNHTPFDWLFLNLSLKFWCWPVLKRVSYIRIHR